MTPSRRDALLQLGAILGVPLVGWQPVLTDLLMQRDASDPLLGTIAGFQAGRVRGDWTSESVTARALERCRTVGASQHAIDMLFETALAEARASDRRARRRALLGALDGAPVFAKSIYDVAGTPTTSSSKEWVALFPEKVARDSLEVARLRAAGAVILGKTAADDFAYRGNGTSSHTGQVLNPYDAAGLKTPGGSSAGSAVAVACGMAFAALGTDDGGSNRIPANFTGVVGMKPTFGLVPRTGVIPTWPILDTHGPLARTVADAALMLDAIAGPDASDGLALQTPWKRGSLSALHDGALTGARLGLVELHAPRAQMTAEALSVWDRALADLRAAGATIESFEPAINRVNVRTHFAESAKARGDVAPNANSPAPTANALLRYFERHGAKADAKVKRGLAAYRAFYDVLPEKWEDMAALMRQPYEKDPALVSFARSRAEALTALGASWRAARVAVMVYPTIPFTAPNAADKWPDIRTPLGYGNWLGLPEVSVPAGIGNDGMPVLNISFTGLPGTDFYVLALAHSYERRSRRFVVPPLAR
jgi:Asp-tRNA(Asn)/Glu-tRNA(Gln) amidotransferase A subunit family amidase